MAGQDKEKYRFFQQEVKEGDIVVKTGRNVWGRYTPLIDITASLDAQLHKPMTTVAWEVAREDAAKVLTEIGRRRSTSTIVSTFRAGLLTGVSVLAWWPMAFAIPVIVEGGIILEKYHKKKFERAAARYRRPVVAAPARR